MNRFLPSSNRPGSVIALFVFTCLPYAGWVTNYFVSDDWHVILRNTQIALADIPQWFLQVRYGWYRPLFELYIALSWRLFGLNPAGYHLFSLLLYGAVALLVGKLAYRLSGDPRVRLLTILLFALHACHSTAVMWISSANELLAGLFAVITIVCYIDYRSTGRAYWYWAAVLSYLLAVTTKETVLFIPLLLLLYDCLFYQQITAQRLSWVALLPTLFLITLTGFHLLLHPPAKAAALTLDLPQLGKNLIYYLTMQFLLIPTRFHEINSSIFTVISIALAAGSLTLLAVLMSYRLDWLRQRQKFLSLVYTLSLTLLALVPVIFEIWERTTFLSSMGVAIMLASGFVNVWDQLPRQSRFLPRLFWLALSLWFCANTVSLLYRNFLWGKAGVANQVVIEELGQQIKQLEPQAKVKLLNLPDRFGDAYAFRNTFPAAAVLVGYPQAVSAVLDVDVVDLHSYEVLVDPPALRLLYKEGQLFAIN